MASPPSSAVLATSRNDHSNDTRWAITVTASAAVLWVLAHRASWFRLLPMRAI